MSKKNQNLMNLTETEVIENIRLVLDFLINDTKATDNIDEEIDDLILSIKNFIKNKNETTNPRRIYKSLQEMISLLNKRVEAIKAANLEDMNNSKNISKYVKSSYNLNNT